MTGETRLEKMTTQEFRVDPPLPPPNNSESLSIAYGCLDARPAEAFIAEPGHALLCRPPRLDHCRRQKWLYLNVVDISDLDQAIQSFTDFVHSLPVAAMKPSRRASWGPREVLIHLVFWHEQIAQIASALARNKEPFLLKGTGRALNDDAVAREIDTPIDRLLERWARAHARFSAIARSRPASQIRIPLRVGAKAWPLADLIRLAAGHIRKHQAKLQNSAILKSVSSH